MAKKPRAADRLPWFLFVGSLLASLWILPLSSFQSTLSSARTGSYNDWICGHSSNQQRLGFVYDIEMETQRVQADIGRMEQQLQMFDNHTDVPSAHAQKHAIDLNSPTRPITDGVVPAPATLRPFLFVGVLSVARNTDRRTALRETWMAAAPPSVIVKFVLYEKERNIDVQRESDLFHDIIFVQGGTTTDYRSIVYKTFAFIQHVYAAQTFDKAATESESAWMSKQRSPVLTEFWDVVQWVAIHANPKFVLKTDDDAYVSCTALVGVLQGLCLNTDCENERVYFGQEKRNGVVITEEDSKWSNLEYFQLTGLKEYVPYMLGGGYAFSFDVAQKLHELNSIAPLKLMPNEDATFGFWVMGMQLRHIAHPKVRAAAGGCCFYMMADEDSTGPSRHVQMRTMQDMCSGWLILHKVETAGQMAYLHHRLLQCPYENDLLAKARQLGRQRGRPAAHTAPHKVMPLQIAMVTDSRTLHHYWSHSDVSPWSTDGRLLLSQRADVGGVQEMLEGSRSRLVQEIGYTNFTAGSSLSTEITGWNWTYLTTSSAWNLQLGSRLQWLGPSTHLVVFNDRDCHQAVVQTSRKLAMSLDVQEAFEANSMAAEQRYMRTMHAEASKAKPDSHMGTDAQTDMQADQLCSVVFDVKQQQRMHVLPRPVYAVSPDGQKATSFAFDRLDAVEAGSGYGDMHAVPHYKQIHRQPRNDGLWLLDISTKAAKLLISIAELSHQLHRGPLSRAKDPLTALPYNTTTGDYWTDPHHCFGYISSATFNAEGSSIVFKYHVTLCSPALFHPNHTYIMTIDLDGGNLWRVPLVCGYPAGLDYGSRGRLIISENSTTYLVDVGKGVQKLSKPAPIAETDAGPCKFYPHQNRYVVCDSFENPHKVYVWDLEANTAFVMGTFGEANWPSPETGRRGLHTHFAPDGQYVSFDSSHIWETGIQTYIAGLQHLPISQSPSRTASYGVLQGSGSSNPQSVPTASSPAQKQDTVPPVVPSEQQDKISLSPQAVHTESAISQSGASQSGSPASLHAPVQAAFSPNSHTPSNPLIARDIQLAPLPPTDVNPEQADFSDVPSGSTSPQSSTVRNMFLCLAAHNGSMLDTFLQGVADPSEWEVVVWQAPADPALGDAAQHYLQAAKQWQGEVGQFVSFTQAAGIIEGNTTISATSETLYDVSMPELSLVLLPHLVPKAPKFDKRSPKWLRKQRAAWLERQMQHLHCLLASAACRHRPWKAIADAAVQHGNTQEWQTIDFPSWLQTSVHPWDQVVVYMDLGAGREFELLHALLSSQSLSLIDHLIVRWHYQAENWHLVLLWEYVLSLLGIEYTSL